LKCRRGWLVLLLGLTLVRGLIYAAITPPWQAPDEWGHFEHVWLIAQLGRLPTPEDVSPIFERELMASLYEWRYDEFFGGPLPERMPARLMAIQPRTVLMQRFSLAYLWSACFLLPFRYQDLVFQLYVARLSSVVLNVVIVWLAWRIFEELLPRQPGLVVAMTAFMVFLPQHTFINASVGEGPLAELAAGVVLYGWLRLLRRERAWGVVAVLGGTLIGVWTKTTAVFLLPLDVLMSVLLLTSRYHGAAWRRRWKYLILSFVLIFLLGLVAFRTPSGQRVRTMLEQWWSAPQVHLENGGLSWNQVLWYTYDSFWAQFGWMNVRAGPGWYVLVYILTVWAIEGWVLPRSHCRLVSSQAKGVLGSALLLAVGVWLAFVLFTPSGLGYYQGRYLFPVTVPTALFLVGGWVRSMPERWQRYSAPGVVILLAALDAAAFCLALWPFFYTQ